MLAVIAVIAVWSAPRLPSSRRATAKAGAAAARPAGRRRPIGTRRASSWSRSSTHYSEQRGRDVAAGGAGPGRGGDRERCPYRGRSRPGRHVDRADRRRRRGRRHGCRPTAYGRCTTRPAPASTMRSTCSAAATRAVSSTRSSASTRPARLRLSDRCPPRRPIRAPRSWAARRTCRRLRRHGMARHDSSRSRRVEARGGGPLADAASLRGRRRRRRANRDRGRIDARRRGPRRAIYEFDPSTNVVTPGRRSARRAHPRDRGRNRQRGRGRRRTGRVAYDARHASLPSTRRRGGSGSPVICSRRVPMPRLVPAAGGRGSGSSAGTTRRGRWRA